MDVQMIANISEVPAEFLKSFVLLVLGLLGGGAAVWSVFGRKKQQIEPQPLQVSQPDVQRRLDRHDEEITELWKTLRKENTNIRAEMARTFQDMERSLGRIEGKIDELGHRMNGQGRVNI